MILQRKLRSSNDDALYWRNLYLEGKLRRQTDAINKMQRKGWQPELVIREIPYEDDKHLWEQPRPISYRRPKRRPLTVIQGI